MLGQSAFGWIDKRLRQITGKMHIAFGGKSIVLIGDPGRLPPVADKPSYHKQPTTEIQLQDSFNYLLFDKVVKLNVNQRVQGKDDVQQTFRCLLDRPRMGDSIQEDWKLLLTRQPLL